MRTWQNEGKKYAEAEKRFFRVGLSDHSLCPIFFPLYL